MSRIQEILKKAEREGAVHRTRGLGGDGAALAASPTSGGAAAALAMPTAMPASMPAAMPLVETREPAAAAATLDGRLVAAHGPQSLAAEQYRSLRTRIKNAEHGRTMRSIIVTSPNKGDGKSLTAANLALTMAQEFQHRVLLVDADLRRPSIHVLFGINDVPGLTDVLMGGATVDDAIVSIPQHHLAVLPAGVLPSHPAELLGSTAMRRTVDALRTRYDRIIIDMPPVAPLADVSIALGMVDGLLMIVRAGVTPKPAIERALSGLDTAKVLGLVLNDAGDGSAAYADGYHYVAG
jgi:capsular exopolysaccharide synthesis family protein